ncbi:MAG: V-type ATP synthase subunit I [Candidatus Thermoplasmatota archaeon]|nr:V-type ATP synthase subunit I [Candidatus Thermoplasmatota archaeon]
MAVLEMERVYVLGYEQQKLEILVTLQKLGIVEISDLKLSLEKSPLKNYLRSAPEIATTEYDQKLATLQYAIDYLLPYQPRPGFVVGLIKSLIESIFGTKFVVSKEEFEKIAEKLDALLQICNKLRDFESELSRLRSEESKISAVRELIKPWENLRINLEELGESKTTFSCLSTLSSLKFDSFVQELQKIANAWLKVINVVGANHYLLVIVLKPYRQELEELFRKYEAHIQTFAEELKSAPKNILKDLDSELKELAMKRTKIEKEISKLAKYRYDFLLAYDYLLIERDKLSALSNLGTTQNTFLLEGWLKKSDVSKLKNSLAKYKNIEIVTRAPLESEQPPVALEEKKLFQPFRLVTNLYGKPAYTEIDPTPFLAPFFLLFFALCLTDAGYGLVLIALSLFFMKKIHGGRGFFMLMLGCGAITVIIGSLTGSFFGNLTGFRAVWLDLMNENDVISFLLFALMLGVIQTIYFGPLIKFYHNIKLKKFKDALFDQVFWTVFLSSVLFILLNALGFFGVTLRRIFGITELFGVSIKALGAALQPYAIYIAIASVIVVVATKGRAHKKIGKRLVAGLASLYGISSYIGDVLSYSRLLALGMTTSAIAIVVNTIAFMCLSTPYIGIVMAVIILIGGHTLNLIINCLGAFVHTLRLQFVEFFSKFLGGATGRGFMPFSEAKKYTEVK